MKSFGTTENVKLCLKKTIQEGYITKSNSTNGGGEEKAGILESLIMVVRLLGPSKMEALNFFLVTGLLIGSYYCHLSS